MINRESEIVAAVEQRAIERRKHASNEYYIYLHAVNDYMSAARQYMAAEAADKLQADLYRKYGL